MKWILILFVIFVFYITVVEPNILTVKHLKIQDDALKGLQVVFASDFHFKPYDLYRLKRIVRKINGQNPDIILFGGDFVNGHTRGNTLKLNTIAAEFSQLKSKYGTYAVMGNHDGWQGRLEITASLEAAGITVLDNENKKFDKFTVSGLEDLQTANPNVEEALYKSEKPIIMLTHTPDMIDKIPETVNITLAGHTHGGQVVIRKPLVVPSKYGTKYAYGLFNENGKKLFVTRGLGTSILPVRFNCFPEIVVIDFI